MWVQAPAARVRMWEHRRARAHRLPQAPAITIAIIRRARRNHPAAVRAHRVEPLQAPKAAAAWAAARPARAHPAAEAWATWAAAQERAQAPKPTHSDRIPFTA